MYYHYSHDGAYEMSPYLGQVRNGRGVARVRWRCWDGCRYMWKCNLSNACKKSIAFPTLIFMKPINAQQHLCSHPLYQISLKSDNKCGKYIWKFIYTPKYGFHCANFHMTHNSLINFCVPLLYWSLSTSRNVENTGNISVTP